MAFSDNRTEMRNAYFGTEWQFTELSRVISVDNKPETFSPRLFSILGDSCSQIENLLRLMCDKLKLRYSKKKAGFPTYFGKLNQTGILRRQQVHLLIGKQVFLPFVISPQKETPTWWTAYNKTKHQLPKGYKKGNLGNTINALAGAYALNCLAVYVNNYGKDVLKNEWWNELDAISLNTQSEYPTVYDMPTEEFLPKSKIFFCLSFYRYLGPESGAPL